jgi:hypothetical protein
MTTEIPEPPQARGETHAEFDPTAFDRPAQSSLEVGVISIQSIEPANLIVAVNMPGGLLSLLQVANRVCMQKDPAASTPSAVIRLAAWAGRELREETAPELGVELTTVGLPSGRITWHMYPWMSV